MSTEPEAVGIKPEDVAAFAKRLQEWGQALPPQPGQAGPLTVRLLLIATLSSPYVVPAASVTAWVEVTAATSLSRLWFMNG